MMYQNNNDHTHLNANNIYIHRKNILKNKK